MRIALWMFFCLVTQLVSSANAGYMDGLTLKATLQAWEASGSGEGGAMAFGFVIGVHDAFEGTLICAPDGIRGGQISAVVLQYLTDNPDKLHTSAAALSLTALMTAWPCVKDASSEPDSEATRPAPEKPEVSPKRVVPSKPKEPASPF